MGTEHRRTAEPVQPLDGIDVTVESLGHQWRIVHVTGELDMVTSPSLHSVVTEVFSDGLLTGRTLVFDLTSVDFIGSSGIAVLAEAVQLANTVGLPPVRVVLAARPVRRAIEVTGMDAVLAIFPDLAAATSD
ncbi:MAG TPA: STAS domain-containing protein [Pseudonocardiaceae bacterium]|nr:STAS domain-containing protein [Pseudonocardiaceae bacterium]